MKITFKKRSAMLSKLLILKRTEVSLINANKAAFRKRLQLVQSVHLIAFLFIQRIRS